MPQNSPIHPNSYFLVRGPKLLCHGWHGCCFEVLTVCQCWQCCRASRAPRQHVFQCCWESGPGGGWARQASSSLKYFFDQVSPCYLMIRLVASHLHTPYFNQTLLLSEHVVQYHGIAPVQLYHGVPIKLLQIFAFAAWAACQVSCPASIPPPPPTLKQ